MDLAIRFLREKNIIAITLISALVFSLLNPRFISLDNLTAISRQIVPIGLIAVGQFFVIVLGGIDLSMGMASVLLSIVFGVLFWMTGDVWLGLAVVPLVGVMLGLFNGVIVAKIKLPAFVVTLCTLFVATGVSGLIIPRGEMIMLSGPFFKALGAGRIFGVYYSVLMLLAMFVVAFVAYNYTRIGAYIVAIGNHEENARLAGINVDWVKIAVFGFAGFCNALAGLILSSRMGFVQPGLDGTGIMLDAITAIIIGGTLIQGGRGTVGGAFWGLLFIGLLNNSLNLLNITDVWHPVFKGLVIIAALGLNWFLWQSRERAAH